MNSRLIALNILMKLEKHHSNSSLLLREALESLENPADRNLITDLVLGTLRWRARLLHFVQHYSQRPLDRIDDKVIGILQIGIYQLLTPGFPSHAAIHETVELCRLVKVTSAKSFVNRILREIQRALPNLPESSDLAVRLSHPSWLVDRWMSRFGREETEALLRINNTKPPLLIRTNELKTTPDELMLRLQQEGIEAGRASFGPGVLEIRSGAPQFSGAFKNGEFYIQDAAIEVLGNVMDGMPGDRILELAAAPGGKTSRLAMRMKNEGVIVSVDSDIHRMQQWKQNMERLGVRCAFPLVEDAKQLAFGAVFDRVVVDAPCSSLGVLRRHPEIKWWRRPEHLVEIQKLQLQILQAGARYLRKGGVLFYSVCSFEPEETTDLIALFLQSSPQFSIEQQRFLYPHRDGTDGFFIAELKLGALAV